MVVHIRGGKGRKGRKDRKDRRTATSCSADDCSLPCESTFEGYIAGRSSGFPGASC